MYKIETNLAESTESKAFSFEINEEKNALTLNGKPWDWDMVKVKENTFHVVKNNQSYMVEVIKADYKEKSFLIKINDTIYESHAKDRFDLLLQELGMDKTSSSKINELKAPMPGLLLDIKVSEGQEVKKGEILLILEAMKMENVLKAPSDVKIKSIKAKKGENVEKNQILLQFE